MRPESTLLERETLINVWLVPSHSIPDPIIPALHSSTDRLTILRVLGNADQEIKLVLEI